MGAEACGVAVQPGVDARVRTSLGGDADGNAGWQDASSVTPATASPSSPPPLVVGRTFASYVTGTIVCDGPLAVAGTRPTWPARVGVVELYSPRRVTRVLREIIEEFVG